ncbi:MAG: D-alanyl-D-alanine carboxypeptidase/D-alanyl-D-alanine-endopeptidase, partial [Rhodocyclaceae bacterium]
ALALAALAALPARGALPPSTAQALQQAKVPLARVALWSGPADGGPATWQHNAGTPMNPASVMKALTTFAALDTLGPAYTWTTEAYVRGRLEAGVLDGDLILRGNGDPSLTWDRLEQLLRDLRSRGLRDIRGDLLIDRSLFGNLPPAAADFDDQPLRAYNATPDALLVNFKAITIRLTPLPPTSAQTPLQAVAITPFAPLALYNTARSTSGPCADWRGGLGVNLLPDGPGLRLELSGQLPASCGERLLNLTVQDGTRMAAGVFRDLWQGLGGSWHGQAREGSAGPDATLLATWSSPPLADVVRDINKWSNNVMARQLYLSLGRSATAPVSEAASERFLHDWLARQPFALNGLVLENGAGLSRNERISADGLAALLRAAWHSPRMPEFLASLPVAGIDGTARRRFANQPVAARAYLKTGSLADVMSVAGYVLDAQNHWQVVVILINDAHPERAEGAVIDAINAVWRGR